MKILMGICGIGNGHVVRQSALAWALFNRGHQLIFFINGNPQRRVLQMLPPCRRHHVWTPWIVSDAHGLRFDESALRVTTADAGGLQGNFEAMDQVAAQFAGKADLVISDYEATSAAYSYAVGCPLVTIDNQSLSLGFSLPLCLGFGPEEERGRMGYLFPRADARICLSLGIPRYSLHTYSINIVRPIIREAVVERARAAREVRNDTVLLYLSSYGPTTQPLGEILDALGAFHGTRFVCYSPALTLPLPPNVAWRDHGDQRFLDELCTSTGLISTAGFGLISEAMYCGIPSLLLPLPTFEQHFNASWLEKEGCGLIARRITEELLKDFLSKRHDMCSTMQAVANGRFFFEVEDQTNVCMTTLNEIVPGLLP